MAHLSQETKQSFFSSFGLSISVLSETALRFEASHVVLVSTVSKKSGAKLEPLSYLSQIQKKFGTHIHIYWAGHQAPLGNPPQNSLTVLRNFSDLETTLKELN